MNSSRAKRWAMAGMPPTGHGRGGTENPDDLQHCGKIVRERYQLTAPSGWWR